MGVYEGDYAGGGPIGRQKDLVLSINEFCFLQNKTNGEIRTHVGPLMTTISQQETLVVFNAKTKKFEEIADFEKAKQLFVSAPEGWYIILKNPTENGEYPEGGKANNNVKTKIGTKVNISGPVSFALYPGQMAKVIRGHALRSNQYLLAHVYEAESANSSQGEMLDTEGNKVKISTNYVNGQILVIKGTEVSFYIPPTGIEVIPIENKDKKGYIREAVTLERLEYCILKDEDGNKRYVHGPEVVFPKPTETFVTSPKGGFIFRAVELSKISGIYVKVIAEYTDDKNVNHPVGEELFITGDQQMIYYPRPEHAIISYDGKIMHHAIAIPNGEGRYVMNRLTGEIKTVRGPSMYLPDPRTEVVVKRKLSARECSLWYPGNKEALEYNAQLNERAVEKSLKDINFDAVAYCSADLDSTLANLEAKANISRGTSYTKPRTITLDNKFEGVVSLDVWTGYAVNVISKNGDRKVVCGPQTILLDYDQTFETLELSTGKPKTTDNTLKTVFLRYENNKVSDIIDIETKDFVKARVKVSYCVDFDKNYVDKWFNVDNYVKYLCDRERSLIKQGAKLYDIEEFYQNYSAIIRDIATDATHSEDTEENAHIGRFFPENGMFVHDVEVLTIDIEEDVSDMLTAHQMEMVTQSLKLTDAEKRVQVAEKLSEAEKKEQELRTQQILNKMTLQKQEAMEKLAIQAELNKKTDETKLASKEAEADLQVIIDTIAEAELERKQKEIDQAILKKQKELELEKAKQAAYAETVAKIMTAISPDLVAAMTTKSNAEVLTAVSEAMSPYAIAQGESVPNTVNKLLRGTPLEGILENFSKKDNN